MKGKEGSGDPEGREAKSGLASSGRGLDTSGEKGFFADVPFTWIAELDKVNTCESTVLKVVVIRDTIEE